MSYTYPQDLTWMDQEFGSTGPLRELAAQVWSANSWIGADLYDVVEDWPNIQLPTGNIDNWTDVPGVYAALMPITEEQRMLLHFGFGGTEDEVNALRAKDHRYTRMTRKDASA